MGDFLSSKEVASVVRGLKVSKLEEIGSKQWFIRNEKVLQLYQLAMVQAKTNNEEAVKDVVLENDKMVFFIIELVTLSVWREKIFSEMIKLKPAPEHSFPVYMVLYHEGILVGLLQTLLFHSDICKSLGDSASDLINYSVDQLLRIQIKTDPNLNNDTSQCKTTMDVIMYQHQVISYNIAIQCLPILRYIVEYLDDLPLGISSQIYTTHDVPCLIAFLLYNNIWTHSDEEGITWKFSDTAWHKWYVDDPALSATECQAWLLLHQLLNHHNSSLMYEYTDYRKDQLTKLTSRLDNRVTDMLSPLADLRHFLNQMTANAIPKSKTTDKPLLVEITPLIKDTLSRLPDSVYLDIAKESAKLLFYGNMDDIQQLATSMAQTFGMLEEVSDSLRTCHNCYQKASKKCSKCKRVWYCSRDCQVQHWKSHKNMCTN